MYRLKNRRHILHKSEYTKSDFETIKYSKSHGTSITIDGKKYESDEIVNDIFFHRDLIMEKRAHFRQIYDHDYKNHPEDFYMNLWDKMRQRHKRVLYWQFNDVQYKTKRYYGSSFLTTFSIWNKDHYDFYRVLQGYDVSTISAYNKNMAHALEKFMKHKRKIYVIPHVF